MFFEKFVYKFFMNLCCTFITLGGSGLDKRKVIVYNYLK